MQCLLFGVSSSETERRGLWDRAEILMERWHLRWLSPIPQFVSLSLPNWADTVAWSKSFMKWGFLKVDWGRWGLWITEKRPPGASHSSRWDMYKFMVQIQMYVRCISSTESTQASSNYISVSRGRCTESSLCILHWPVKISVGEKALGLS